MDFAAAVAAGKKGRHWSLVIGGGGSFFIGHLEEKGVSLGKGKRGLYIGKVVIKGVPTRQKIGKKQTYVPLQRGKKKAAPRRKRKGGQGGSGGK